jgi:hypothetical protein
VISRIAGTVTFKFAVLWFVWLIAVTLAYYDTNISLLRAENGWFHILCHSAPAPHGGMLRDFLMRGGHGHYTPFAFYTELELSYLFGTNEALWKWRQLGAVTILAVCLSLLSYSLARVRGISPWRACVIAGGLAAVFVFQPMMRELVAWPFMVLQVIAGSLSAFAAFAILRWVIEPTSKTWIWLAAGISYLSMHFIGYGVATVVATEFVFTLALVGIWTGHLSSFAPTKRTLLICWVVLAVLAGIHGGLMEGLRITSPLSPNVAPVGAKSVLVFCVGLFLAAIRSLISFDPPPSFDSQLPLSLWPWGLFLVVIAAVYMVSLARSCLQRPTRARLSRFALSCFSIVAFFGFTLTAVARQVAEPNPSGFHNFLLGARYLVPANLLLFGLVVTIVVDVMGRPGWSTTLLFFLLGATALIASRELSRRDYNQLYASGGRSHAKTWRAIVSLSRECRAAGLPVPNVPMKSLTYEFYDWDLRQFEPLLRHSLRLAPEIKIEFEPWENVAGIEFEKYQAVAPSLPRLVGSLNLPRPPN